MVARVARIGALVAASLFLAAVVAQVFLAGMALFDERGDWAAHINLGWIIHLAPLLVLLLVALSRPPRQALWLAVALAVVVFVQPILATLRRDAPLAAALHPVLALVIFALATSLVLRLASTFLAPRAAAGTGAASPAPPAG